MLALEGMWSYALGKGAAESVFAFPVCLGISIRSAINSPKILELSGIGDASVLRGAGVEVKLDLPGVGNNLQDHWYIGLSYGIHFLDDLLCEA